MASFGQRFLCISWRGCTRSPAGVSQWHHCEGPGPVHGVVGGTPISDDLAWAAPHFFPAVSLFFLTVSAVRHWTCLATLFPLHICSHCTSGAALPTCSPPPNPPITPASPHLTPLGFAPYTPGAPRALASSRGGWSWGSCRLLRWGALHPCRAALSLQHVSAQLSFDRHIGKDALVEAELNIPREPTCPQNLPWLRKRLRYLPALRPALGNFFRIG